MQYLKIHDWEEWQSYRKDRGQPPWIKVHREIMRKPKWVSLSDDERGQLLSIWILAADEKGQIPNDPQLIQKLCYMTNPPNLNHFINLGWIESNGCQLDANSTPERRQHDVPEAEAEADTEKIKEPASPAGADLIQKLVDRLNEKCKKINALPKKKEKFNPHQFVQWCANHKYHPDAVDYVLDALISMWDSINNPWTYAQKIIGKQSGNFYEKDATKKHDKMKVDFVDLVNRLKSLGGS